MLVTDDPVLLVEQTDTVCTLTLNRPHRKNAIDRSLWAALHAALYDIAHGRDVRAVVITGAGGAFSGGADLTGAGEVGDTPDPAREIRLINEVIALLHDLPVPTVAKIPGVAVGAGWNLALACDLVVASEEATFSQIFARRGLSLDTGGSWLLPELVGLQQAKRLVLLAEKIDAEEARRLGLVTWVRPADDIDSFVDDVAARLAAGPPLALAQSKALLNEGADVTMQTALGNEARALSINLSSADVIEAFAAYTEKRDPVFTGG